MLPVLEFTTTIMDSSSSTTNEEESPSKKRYRYSSERHPYRIFENIDLDGFDDDEDDDSLLDVMAIGHRFAEVSRISTFTAPRPATSAGRQHPARKARRDEHQQQASPATVPRRVSVASMTDDEDMADDNVTDNQEHNDGTTAAAATTTTTTTTSTTSTTTSQPRNVSLQLLEVETSVATSATAQQSTKKKTKRLRPQKHISRWSEAVFGGGGGASLPSLAHTSASSAVHLSEMEEEDRMVLEE